MKTVGRILAILMWSFAADRLSADTWPTGSVGTQTAIAPTTALPKAFEASGIVWHPGTERLYVVSDSQIASLSKTGGDEKRFAVKDGAEKVDMESITATDSKTLLYVGVEFNATAGGPQIRALRVPEVTLTGEVWTLHFPKDDKGNETVNSGNGMEGMTWIPNGSHPYANSASGGLFYASSQKNNRIYVFDVDLANTEESKWIDTFKPADQKDISDLYYDPPTRLLYVLYDTNNKLVEIDPSTTAYEQIATYDLPALPEDQEGVTLLPDCSASTTTIFLASDKPNQGIYSFPLFPELCATSSSPTGDATISRSATNLPINYGSTAQLLADTNPEPRDFLIRFAPPANAAQIVRARLLLYAHDGTTSSPSFCGTVDPTPTSPPTDPPPYIWDSATVTGSKAPACTGTATGGGAKVEDKSWVGYDVTTAYKTYSSFRFTAKTDNDFGANSSRASANPPHLLVWTQKPAPKP